MTTFESYIAIAKGRLDDAAECYERGILSYDEVFKRAEDAIAAIRFAIDQTKIEVGRGYTDKDYA